MKHISRILLVVCFSVLFGCGPQVQIEGNESESNLIIDEKRDLLAIYALVENTSTIPSGSLYAKFELHHEKLISFFGQDALIFQDQSGDPFMFKVGANNGYFISQMFDFTETIPEEEFVGAIEVVIYTDKDEVVEQFPITNVEKVEQ
ncbi:hypothetical protein [Bacillus alkalicellulosilyticus]|uniref:hypothetical protein n=1 Tax=Alkalihalobacterium alkalicellulosilyticum TaxID=1912214 RepID=UPI0009963B05|nr:hypothetical protein [Bacillus alkalicellulosilyticus]